MSRLVGVLLILAAVLLTIAHMRYGLHKYTGELAHYFLGDYVGIVPGSFIAEFLLYIVFFFIGVSGGVVLARTS